MIIRTPDHRLRIFVSSTLKELADERKAVRQAILKLRLSPVMFESGARPHPAQELYQSYLSQSQIFIGIYWQSYGWVAPNTSISGLEDEYNLSANMPRLIYVKNPAPNRETALVRLLDRIRDDNTTCYTYFSTPAELEELVQNDLALLLTERFETFNRIGQPSAETRQYSPTNVPVPRTALIDREQELVTARNLLLRDDIALITLTGVGGTGKSRLALQIGLEMLDHFQDGVFLVSLSAISDPKLVISTISETLGIREAIGSRPVSEMLIEFLRDKQMLLLLDNFEQVLVVAPYIAEMLEACPRVKCIVTSRAPLRLRAENLIPVPPLAFPSLENFNDLGSPSQYAAVELFIQRAQAVKPDFTLTKANAGTVAEICYRLDGLPLAIELAAARIKLFTPYELLSRLEHRFDLLRSGALDLPERQRTLRGAIDWSYNLLNEQEKKLFRRLSIFVGGWTLEAAETVCDIGDDLALSLEDTLASLLDNSLVIPVQGTKEQSRFGMLTTINEYAYDRLVESDETDSIRGQHAQYYRHFVETVEPLIRSMERVRWHQVMQQEFGNIRSVLEWVSTTGNCIDIGQQIVILLGMFWIHSGYIAEGRHWCTHIIALSDESTPVAVRAGLLWIAGLVTWAKGDHPSAQSSLDESLELLGKLDSRMMEDDHLLAQVLFIRGVLASTSPDLGTATAMYQRSIELFRETKDLWYEALAISFLAGTAYYENDKDHAKALYDQSIQLARRQGDPWCLVPSLMASAQIAVLDGDLSMARSILLEAIVLLRNTGDQWSLTWALNELGHVALMEGELDEAGVYLLEGLTLGNALGNRAALIISLAGSASLIARRSKVPEDAKRRNTAEFILAAHLCGATTPYVGKPGVFFWIDSKRLYETALSQVQSLMDVDFWAKAYSEGQSMTLNQAIALAIQSLKEILTIQTGSGQNKLA